MSSARPEPSVPPNRTRPTPEPVRWHRAFAVRLSLWYALVFLASSSILFGALYWLLASTLEQREQTLIQRKLDEYLESVRDVERRIEQAGKKGELQGWRPTLSQPDRPRPADGIPQDIDEHMRSEQRLRQSEERFSRIFQLLPYPMGISRRSDGVYLELNPAWEAMFGYTRQEALGRSVTELGILGAQDRKSVV